MAKKFEIYITADAETKKITSFAVNDGADTTEANTRPNAAIFPISLLYDEDTQRTRAHKLMDYLNSMVDITNDLEKETKI